MPSAILNRLRGMWPPPRPLNSGGSRKSPRLAESPAEESEIENLVDETGINAQPQGPRQALLGFLCIRDPVDS